MANSSAVLPSGQSYTINSVKVQFPCKAYPSQLSMMDKILKGLDRSQNCLLESPTGSGKSLALLCSALAWQKAEYEKVKQEEDSLKDEEKCCCQCTTATYQSAAEATTLVSTDVNQNQETSVKDQAAINVIDLDNDVDDDFKIDNKKLRNGRVQGQFSSFQADAPPSTKPVEVDQGADDGDKCACKCKTFKKKRVPKIFFGTRTHKQIAQIIRELGKTAYRDTRMTILSSREHSCIHPEIAPYPNKNESCKELLEGVGCPYFERTRRVFSHSFLENAHLPQVWDMEDITRFGKKHRACSYFGVRQLRETADIIFCPYNYLIDPSVRKSMDISLNSQVVILDEAHNIEDSSRDAAGFSVTQAQLLEAMQDLEFIANMGVKPAEHRTLRAMCADLGELIERNKNTTTQSDGYDATSRIWTGIEIVAQLELLGINATKFANLQSCYSIISARDEEPNEIYMRRRPESKKGDEMKIKSATSNVLDGLFMVLNFIYKEGMKFVDDYRAVIVKSMSFTNGPTENRWLGKKRKNREMAWTYMLNFWCMNPAVAFTDMSSGVRSIVLTSGTLSPMTSFQSELGVPFPIQLEANHVIGNKQVWVGCLSRGPSNVQLLGSYQTAETWAYQDEIGNILLEVCQTVPFGVLCFLPSYKSLEKLSCRWQDTGLLDKIRLCKKVITEPRSSNNESFDDVLRQYYDVIQQCTLQDQPSSNTLTGAVFLAVCRGKVSEGMDFADNNARSVILIGIPYPNVRDAQIELKKKYNDERSVSKGLLCGRDWYDIQAYRAMNQALGRCIRHRADWGSLILVDERYAKNQQKYTTGLSKWVRQRVQFFNMFSHARSSLQQFTDYHIAAPVCTDVSANESLILSPKIDAEESLVATPLRSIQNIEEPKIVERKLMGNMKSMSHGDIRCFVQPSASSTPYSKIIEGHSRRNRYKLSQSDYNATSCGNFCLPAAPSASAAPQAFSQAGGFIIESQSVDISQTGKVDNETILIDDDDEAVMDVDLQAKTAHQELAIADVSLCPVDFLPVMASTQVVDLRKPNDFTHCSLAAVAFHASIERQSGEVANIEKTKDCSLMIIDRNVPSSFMLPTKFASNCKNGLEELNAMKHVETIADSKVTENESSFVSPLKFEWRSCCKESAVEENKSVFDIADYRSDSPDLFDNDDVNTEDINAVLKELSASQYRSGGGMDTVKLEAHDSSLSKISTNDTNSCLDKTNSDAKPSLASKLLVQQTKLLNAKSPQLLATDANSASPGHINIDSTVTSKSGSRPQTSKIIDVADCRRRSTRMTRKKRPLDQVPSNFNAKHRTRGVDFLDEIDEESSVKILPSQFTCPTCCIPILNDKFSDSLADSIVLHETYKPAFWKLMASGILQGHHHTAVSFSVRHLGDNAVVNQSPLPCNSCPSVMLNSYWSDEDGCCTQPIYCRTCASDGSTTWLGVEIKAVSSKHCAQIHLDQVWLVPQCFSKP